ncbi:MAG: DNA-directed RNA polymerase subunit omega [Candidatus Omnitrophica bacterium]|nr:DNA-directed RNA polymerase subunit omega [Candidatus Omnitrophota bacterium]
MSQGATRLVDMPLTTKPTIVALQEIAEKKIEYKSVEKAK